MIKTSSLAFTALPSRLTLATSISPPSSPPPPCLNSSGLNGRSQMSTDATAASDSHPHHRTQQPMLASQRAKQQRQQEEAGMSQAENLDKGRPRQGGLWNLFPLGYKEAAHQWVSTSRHAPRQSTELALTLALYSGRASPPNKLSAASLTSFPTFEKPRLQRH
jgi:cardiolipin-specific phospholipase